MNQLETITLLEKDQSFSNKKIDIELNIFYNEIGIKERIENNRGLKFILQEQIDRINLFYNSKIREVITSFEDKYNKLRKEKYELIYQLTKKSKVQFNYQYLLEQQMLQYEILKDKIAILRSLEKKELDILYSQKNKDIHKVMEQRLKVK